MEYILTLSTICQILRDSWQVLSLCIGLYPKFKGYVATAMVSLVPEMSSVEMKLDASASVYCSKRTLLSVLNLDVLFQFLIQRLKVMRLQASV